MKGFTIMETILVITVVAIIGIFIAMILINNTGLFYLETSKVDQGLHINDVLSSIHGNIRRASSVAVGYPEISPTYTTSSTALVLKLSSTDSLNNVIQGSYDYIVYYLDVNKLRYKSFSASGSTRSSADQILAFNVDKVLFQYFDSLGNEVSATSAIKVRVSITLKQKAGALNLSNSATSEAYLRND